jgi:hypothetical protein
VRLIFRNLSCDIIKSLIIVGRSSSLFARRSNVISFHVIVKSQIKQHSSPGAIVVLFQQVGAIKNYFNSNR